MRHEGIHHVTFRSVYFREPGHVLFEIATDPPGFAVDEPVGDSRTSARAAAIFGGAAKEDRGHAARAWLTTPARRL